MRDQFCSMAIIVSLASKSHSDRKKRCCRIVSLALHCRRFFSGLRNRRYAGKRNSGSRICARHLARLHAGHLAGLLAFPTRFRLSSENDEQTMHKRNDAAMKILLVEDDPMIGENIQIGLENQAISVDWVTDGTAAETAICAGAYDAMVLDLGLPKKDGIDVLKGLRAQRGDLPVLIVSARGGVTERVLGLESGADDYLIKPFDLKELSARLHALVRRSRGRLEDVYRSGNVTVIRATRQVLLDDKQVILSAREWAILDALVARPGAILSRTHLEEHLYGWASDVESNAVEVYIHGLRKKLGQQFVVNVRGLGYMVERDPCDPSARD